MACSFSDRSENTAREEEKSMERCDRRAVNSPFGRTTTAQRKVPVKSWVHFPLRPFPSTQRRQIIADMRRLVSHSGGLTLL